MKSQKLMIEEAIMAEVKESGKMTVSKVSVNLLDVERDCIVLTKNGSKADTVQVRYINNDNTIDQLEIRFKGKSLTIEKACATTNEFNVLDPYRVLSKVNMEKVDLNKLTVNLGGLYVPAVIILSKVLRDRATSKTLQSILKEFDIIDNKRVKVEVAKDKKSMDNIVIDLNVYKTGENKPVDLRNNSWKRMETIILDIKDNRRCVEIFENSKEAFEDVIVEENINKQGVVKESNKDGEENMSKELELKNKIVEKGITYSESFKAESEDSVKEMISLLFPDIDVDTLFKLKGFRNVTPLEITEDCKDASTPEEFAMLGQVLSVITGDEEQVEGKFEEALINKLKEDFKDEEGIDNIDMKDVLDTIKSEIEKMDNKVTENENIENTEEVKEEVISSTGVVAEAINKEDDNKFDLGNDVLSIDDENKISPFSNKVVERIMDTVTENIQKMISGNYDNEIKVKERVEEEVISHKELSKSTVDKVEEFYVDGHVVHNSLLKYCVSLEDGNIEGACKKYKAVLNYVEDMLEPDTINKLAKEYSSVSKVMNMYSTKELDSNIIYRFDYVKELIETLYNNVPGYGKLKSVLTNIPLDLTVNIIYSLCNKFDRTIESMCFDEKISFYAVFEEILNIIPGDLVKDNEKSELVQKALSRSVNFYVHRDELFMTI